MRYNHRAFPSTQEPETVKEMCSFPDTGNLRKYSYVLNMDV